MNFIFQYFLGVFFVAAKRTPFGKFGGGFINKSATDLSVVAATSAINSAGLKPEQIDHVIFGNVLSVCINDFKFISKNIIVLYI